MDASATEAENAVEIVAMNSEALAAWEDALRASLEYELEVWREFKRGLTCMDSAREFANWYAMESVWEHRLDILNSDDTGLKFELFASLKGRDNYGL